MTAQAPSASFPQKLCSVCQQALSAYQLLATQQPTAQQSSTQKQFPGTFQPLNADNTLYCCGSFACKSILDKQTEMTAPQFAAFLQFQSKNIQTTKENALKAEKLRLLKLENCQKENQQLRENFLKFQKVDARFYPLLALPSCWRDEKQIEFERKSLFSAHLRELLSAAMKAGYKQSDEEKSNQKKLAETNTSIENHSKLKNIVISACTLCQGGCCTKGGNHAYLSPGTLREFGKKNNLKTGDQIHAKYMASIPSRSIKNSCLFQTTSGCNLPREMRSDICNAYLCDGLKKIHSDHINENNDSDNTLEGVITIVRAQDNWQTQESLEESPCLYVGLINTEKEK